MEAIRPCPLPILLAALVASALPATAQTGQLVGLGDRCVDVFQASTDDGSPIVLYQCTGNSNQTWSLNDTAQTTDVVGLGGKCLVPGPIGDSGHPEADLMTCASADSAFRISGDLRGEFELIHDSTGLCLDVFDSSTANATPLIFFACQDQQNQRWRLTSDTQTPALFVPFVEVDRSNSLGATTLFAVRNDSASDVRVRYEYFGASNGPGEALVTQEQTLAAHGVRSVDTRQVTGFSSFLGWIGITAIDTATGQPLAAQDLYGDYFLLNRADDFASGDRLVSKDDGLCNKWHIRFFNGGTFNGGTLLRFFVPEFGGTWTVGWQVFTEEGQIVTASGFTSNQRATSLSAFSFPTSFGAVEFQFQDGVKGHVSGVLDALGRFSVGLDAECRD